MKRVAIVIGMVGMLVCVSACIQNKETVQPKVSQPVGKRTLAKEALEEVKGLAKFADSTITLDTSVNDVFDFYEMATNDSLVSLNSNDAVALMKRVMKAKESKKIPVFRFKNGEKSILIVGAQGYEGPIWAKVLLDETTLQVTKIEFGHEYESDGYGAGITRTTFEQQFRGASLKTEGLVFGLQQGSEELVKGSHRVDGISGATVTCSNAVKMVNGALQRYQEHAMR